MSDLCKTVMTDWWRKYRWYISKNQRGCVKESGRRQKYTEWIWQHKHRWIGHVL